MLNESVDNSIFEIMINTDTEHPFYHEISSLLDEIGDETILKIAEYFNSKYHKTGWKFEFEPYQWERYDGSEVTEYCVQVVRSNDIMSARDFLEWLYDIVFKPENKPTGELASLLGRQVLNLDVLERFDMQ